MEISISSKTSLIIQASIVASLIPIDIFSVIDRLAPLFYLPYCFWPLSYSDLIKNKDDK